MIDFLINIGKLLLVVVPFVALCFASTKINIPKQNRSKQLLMPLIGVIYSLVTMLLMNSINKWLLKLIKNIPKWIKALASFSWMPPQLSKIVDMVSGYIEKFLNNLDLVFWIFFISNIVILSVYMLSKKICISIMSKKIKTDGTLHTLISEKFYEYFPEKNVWCIKDGYVQARQLMKVFFYSAVVISTVLMMLSRWLYYKKLLATVFYPVFGIIIVGEIYLYLDGLTKKEYSNNILGEDEDAYKTVNYSLLRKFLRSVFGDKLLSENTSINNALAYDVTTEQVIHELEQSEDQKVVTFASYFDALNKTGFKIDHNYLRSSLDMLSGTSVLFNNPFYNDLIPYAFYPMNRALLSHKKVLVVLGRHSIENDIIEWIQKGIEAVTNIPFIWNVGILDMDSQDLDIGIVTRSDVLNIGMHNANSQFLEQVGFVVVIEPSKLITTAQIGLNLLAKKCKSDADKEIVYCLCDKNCDGLVDAMSHILMTSLTEVSATEKHIGTVSYMCWEADEEYLHHRLLPNISRYLGMGTELSFAALKNQVSKTKWYGGESFPVVDMRWIDKQYYYDLTKYANLPSNQEVLDEHFLTSSNFWSADVEKNCYITVEDEAYNMFEILRDFSTRTTEQGFINVISSDYLLKDYMADNASIFETDAKAIPLIVADYIRSNRNVALKFILMLSTYPVSVDIIERELSLLGIQIFDLKKQLWFEFYKCYSEVSVITQLPDDYRRAVNSVYDKPIVIDNEELTHDVIEVSENYSIRTGNIETTYFISNPLFLMKCTSELKSAGYVAEDEKGEKYYLGSELSGHIYQKYLPGQFFTFGGKYYEMQYLTADGHVLVRRAADHIVGRPTYRQIRDYTINGVISSDKIGAYQNVSGLKVVKEFADIVVDTAGYYSMERYNDFTTAKCIQYEGDKNKNGIPIRTYRNKEILRIELPNSDGMLTDDIRYTVTLLINEIFRTIFAENQAYICALTDLSFMQNSTTVNPLTYSLRSNGCELNKNSIYIIEDSQLDLGLTVTVERNIHRILSMVHDYLDWHFETLEFSLNPPEDPAPQIIFSEEQPTDEQPKKKEGFFARIKKRFKKIIDKIKGWFKRKPKKKKTPQDEVPVADGEVTEGTAPTEDIPNEGENPAASDTSVEDTNKNDGISTDSADLSNSPLQGDVVYSNDNEQIEKYGFSVVRKPYHERYYMLYGCETELPNINLKGALDYLSEMGLDRNSLKQARNGKMVAEIVEATFKPGKPDARYCDFCGSEIYGVEYETLADGRDRCLACGKTAIKTEEEFRRIFEDVKRNMESFFGIKINAGIRVEMVNSKKLHRVLGKAFVPTPVVDGRVLGVAINDGHGNYSLYVENGSPRMASMLTMAHELTHIWQYINWNDKAIKKKYGKKLRLEIYEGMAKWVEIQYAHLINEPAIAKREEILTSYRDDEYGRGFLRYRANYPFSMGTVITKETPFMNLDTPLALEYCTSFVVKMPTDGINPEDVEQSGHRKPQHNKPIVTGVPKPSQPIKGPIERDPDNLNRYAFNLLNSQEKLIYERVLTAITNLESKITDFEVQIDDTQIKKIVEYVKRDNPQLFWFRHGSTYYFDSATRIVNKIELTYCFTKEEVEARQEEINLAIKQFIPQSNKTMSDYELTLRVFENIIKLVDYDSVGLSEQDEKLKNEATIPDDLRSIYGVFVNKKAVCVGYAKATQYLLNMLGIECTYITSDTHAWNLIKLEGDYYHLDTTWGDGSNTDETVEQSNRIKYHCFCITTEDLEKLEEHTPDETLPLPVCDATKCNYYHRQGLCFEKFEYSRIKDLICERVSDGVFDITLKYTTNTALNEAKLELLDNGRLREAIKYASFKTGVRIDTSFSYCIDDDRIIASFYLNKL